MERLKRWLPGALLVLAACSGTDRSVLTSPAASGEEAVVRACEDGDTVVLEDGRGVRYIGIDTPEMPDQPLAREAMERNRQLVEGRRIRIELDHDQTDKYGRTLAYVWLRGADGSEILVNELLLREGLAGVYPFPGTTRYSQRLVEAQLEARRANAGIWKDPPKSDEPYYVAVNPRRFHRPSCRDLARARMDRAVQFANRDLALDTGRSPCRNCRP